MSYCGDYDRQYTDGYFEFSIELLIKKNNTHFEVAFIEINNKIPEWRGVYFYPYCEWHYFDLFGQIIYK